MARLPHSAPSAPHHKRKHPGCDASVFHASVSLTEVSESQTAYLKSRFSQLWLGNLKAVTQPFCISNSTFIEWRQQGDLVHGFLWNL